MALPEVGLSAVIDNLASFKKGADSINKAYDEINKGADGVETGTSLASGAIGGLGATATTVASGGLTLLVGAVAAVAAGAAAATASIGLLAKAAFDLSSEVEASQKDIQAQLGLTAEESENLGNIARDVWADNFAGSITEATEALIEVRKQLKGISDEELKDATENAIRLSDAFGIDITESTNAANALMSEFGLTQQEAFDFITKGFQEGLNTSDDFLDSVREYSNQFSSVGFDAQQMFNILDSGLQSGVLGTDKISDAIKEMNIRLGEGGDEVKDAFGTIGLDFDQIEGSVRSGDEAWGEYFENIITGINNIEDPIERARVQVAIFGTMAEDLGPQFTESLTDGKNAIVDFAGATDSLNAQYETLPQAFEGVKRQLLVAIQPIGDALLDTANEVMPILLDAIEDLKPVLEDFAIILGEWITDAVRELIPWIQKKLIPALKDMWKFIDKRVLPVIEDLWDLFDDAKKQGKEVEKAFDKMNDVIEPFVKKTMANLLEIWEIIAKWVDKNWPLIEKTITVVMKSIQDEIEKVTSAIQKIWDKWGDEIMAVTEFVFDTIWDVAKTGIENVLDVISAVMKVITGDYEGAWEDIERITDRSWELINSIISNALDVLERLVEKALNELKSKIEQIWNNIKSSVETIVTNMINAIVSKIQSSVTSVQNAISTMFTTALNYISSIIGNLSAVSNIVTNLINSLSAKIRAAWDTIRQGISFAIQTALNAFNINTIATALSNIATAIGNALKSRLAAVWTLIRDGLTTAINLAAGLISIPITVLKNVGDAIVQAIIDGINAAKQELKDLLSGLADDIPQWLKDFLGIASPAKVAIPIGQEIIRGLQQGIALQTPNLTGQLQTAVAAPLVSSTPTLGATSTVNTTNVFNVGGNTISSGMDSAVFEARVLQVIRQNL